MFPFSTLPLRSCSSPSSSLRHLSSLLLPLPTTTATTTSSSSSSLPSYTFHSRRSLSSSSSSSSPCCEVVEAVRSLKSGGRGVGVEEEEAEVSLVWQNSEVTHHSLVWLRDNCQCPSCVDPSSRQKLHASSQLFSSSSSSSSPSIDFRLDSLKVQRKKKRRDRGEGEVEETVVGLKWRDGHETELPSSWLFPFRTSSSSSSSSSSSAYETSFDLPPPLLRNLSSSSPSSSPISCSSAPPSFEYEELMNTEEAGERNVWRWLQALNTYGVTRIRGVPTHPISPWSPSSDIPSSAASSTSSSCSSFPSLRNGSRSVEEDPREHFLGRVVGRITKHRRQTIYGDSWEVKAVREAKNLAYTSTELQPHQDLLYYLHSPGFQFLHCLRFTPKEVEGGDSVFVDSLAVIEHLRENHPRDFLLLSSPFSGIRPTFQYHHHHSHHLRQRRSALIELDSNSLLLLLSPSSSSSSSSSSSLVAIESEEEVWWLKANSPLLKAKVVGLWWSPPWMGPLQIAPNTSGRLIRDYYKALSLLSRLIDSRQHLGSSSTSSLPRFGYEFTMKEGDLLAFDNRRMLHARTSYKERIPGQRHLHGCYIDRDEFENRFRVLHERFHQVS